ncbi:MAG: endolytic transglycosylase MltG [Oscillospiraceae bacterium]|nr:endolytic transglycosylase MltG [Oscillospiraceae bacterium]
MDRENLPGRQPTGAEQRALRQQAGAYQAEGNRGRSPVRPLHEPPKQRPVRYPAEGRQGAVPPHSGGGRSTYPPENYNHQPGEDDNQGQPRGGRGRPRGRWFVAMVMVASTLAICLFVSIFLVQSAFDLLGLNQEDRQIEVTIPQDAGISDVVRILGQAGVVNHPTTFRFYLNFRSVQEENLLPGDYIFNARMSYDEVIRAMMTGRTVREVVRLTFIEGWTLWDYALHLEEHGVVDAEVFIEYLGTADFGFEFFNMIDRHPHRFHMLEGYLFPDTYDFYVGENVGSVARKFLRNFNDRVMTPQMLARMEYMGLTVDETITLASIIQREAGFSDDMRIVSSVFHNRLNSPNFPRLESDVTWRYIDEEILPRLTVRNQALLDAYDTYVTEGLPIGPVCNPGMDAIMAALHPERTQVNFFFFVTDVNGDFYYAVTYAQHQQNIAQALSVGDEIGGIDTPHYR